MIGYRAWFYYAERKADIAMETRLDKDQYDENDLISITVPLDNPYQLEQRTYQRIDGEINFQGKNFKYVKRKVSDGKLILLCIPDARKMVLKKAKAEYGFQMNKWSVHVTPSTGGWKGKDGDSITFSGWSDCEEVNVYVNDVLKKTITMRTNDGSNEWSAYNTLFGKDTAINDMQPFVSGSTIKFVGKNAGVVMDTQVFKPMLDASRIVVTPNPGKISTAGDISVVIVTIQDANGNIIPDADSSITVNVSGSGTLIGLGSADADANRHGNEPEKFVNHKFTFQGMLKAFVQSTDAPGTISISASGNGLFSGSATVATVRDLAIP